MEIDSLKDIVTTPALQSRKLKIIEKNIEVIEKIEDNHWKSCCLTTDKRAIRYFSQLGIAMTVIIFCMRQLLNKELKCGEENVYIGMLTSIIGIFLPQPSMS